MLAYIKDPGAINVKDVINKVSGLADDARDEFSYEEDEEYKSEANSESMMHLALLTFTILLNNNSY